METANLTKLAQGFDQAIKADTLNISRFANLAYDIKEAYKIINPLNTKLQKYAKNNLKKIRGAKSSTVQVEAVFQSQGMRWDDEKLGALMLKYGLDAEDYKSDRKALFIKVKKSK